MVHIIDSEYRFTLGALWSGTANCGAVLRRAKIKFKNDWGKGECREWLDRENMCGPCREKAIGVRSEVLQFSYGVKEISQPENH